MSTSSPTLSHHDPSLFFADKAEVVQEILGRYPDYGKRSAVMPLLWEVQRAERYISEARLKEIADIVEISPTEVKGVMSFYSTYHAEPIGKYHLQICSTLSCALAGSDEMYDFICEETGLVNGETAKDGHFSIQKVECLGSCGTAPVLQVNDIYYENVGKKRCQQILESLRQGVMPEVERARGGDNVALSHGIHVDTPPTAAKAKAETSTKASAKTKTEVSQEVATKAAKETSTESLTKTKADASMKTKAETSTESSTKSTQESSTKAVKDTSKEDLTKAKTEAANSQDAKTETSQKVGTVSTASKVDKSQVSTSQATSQTAVKNTNAPKSSRRSKSQTATPKIPSNSKEEAN